MSRKPKAAPKPPVDTHAALAEEAKGYKHRSTEFDTHPLPGARFFTQDGEEMFQFVVDRTASIGPRVATERDKAEHAGAYEAFKAKAA